MNKVNEMQLHLECTWRCLQSISQKQMTRLRVSAVFHRSVEDYYQKLLQLRLDLQTLCTNQQQQQHNYGSSNSEDKKLATATNATERPEIFEHGHNHLRQHLLERKQLLVEVGRMVRLGRLLKTRLKEPFILDGISGRR